MLLILLYFPILWDGLILYYYRKFRKYSRDIQHFLPEKSHELRYYQSFRSFSPFSDAEALEDGEAARRLGLSADSAAVPLQNVP